MNVLERRDSMFYNKVLDYCKKNEISISQFEKMCNIGNGTIGRWKNDKSKPSLNTIEKISLSTGTPISEWIG